MTDTTQPPAETLAEAREAAALAFDARARKASHPEVVTLERHHAKVIREGEGDEYDAVQAAVIALTRRAGGDAIPAGWQLVPVKPTREMVDAACLVDIEIYPTNIPSGLTAANEREARSIWSAMLSVSTKPPAGGDASCKAAPDHADIMETIQNAADDWQKKGYATALAEVRDMANVGRALMEALPEGYSYINCPSEIVSDLQNERDDAVDRAGGDAGAAVSFAETVKAELTERAPTYSIRSVERPHFDRAIIAISELIRALALPAPVVEGNGRERFKMAMAAAARARGGAGAAFIADGHTNVWLDAAYDAFAALSEGRSHG